MYTAEHSFAGGATMIGTGQGSAMVRSVQNGHSKQYAEWEQTHLWRSVVVGDLEPFDSPERGLP